MTRLTALLALGCLVAHPIQAQSVKVSVLDRGQADGIVIRTPNHQWVVIWRATAPAASKRRSSFLYSSSERNCRIKGRCSGRIGGIGHSLTAGSIEKEWER